MMGVWDYLHNKAQAPENLTLALRCRQWNTLPYAGGYLNQPIRRMKLMELALDYYESIAGYMEARKTRKDKNWIDWQKAHPHAVKIFGLAAKEDNGEI